MPSPSSTRLGIFFIILGMLIFSIMNAIIKDATSPYDPIQIISFRCFFAGVPLLFFLRDRKKWIKPTPREWGFHLLRMLLLALGLYFLFTGIKKVSLSESMALYFSSTFFLVLFSYPILREKASLMQWIAVSIGLGGVLIIANPTPNMFNWGAAFVMIGALMEAVYNLYGRLLSSRYNSYFLTFLGSVLPALLMGGFLPFVWKTPDLKGWIALIGLGFCGGLGQLCLTLGYSYAPAGILAPMIYSALVWSILFDIILYGNWPTFSLLVGCGVIIFSGFVVLLSERHHDTKKPLKKT